jgi:hypothetical protein
MKSKTSKEKHGKERISRGNQQSMNNLGPEKQIKMQQRGNTERSLAGFSGFDFCFGFSIDLFSDLSSLYSSVFERGSGAWSRASTIPSTSAKSGCRAWHALDAIHYGGTGKKNLHVFEANCSHAPKYFHVFQRML